MFLKAKSNLSPTLHPNFSELIPTRIEPVAPFRHQGDYINL